MGKKKLQNHMKKEVKLLELKLIKVLPHSEPEIKFDISFRIFYCKFVTYRNILF